MGLAWISQPEGQNSKSLYKEQSSLSFFLSQELEILEGRHCIFLFCRGWGGTKAWYAREDDAF